MGLSRQRFVGKGPRPRNNGSQSGPLRRILCRVSMAFGADMEALECGHYQLPKQDIAGETNAVRRRCRKCKRNAPQDFDPEDERYQSCDA